MPTVETRAIGPKGLFWLYYAIHGRKIYGNLRNTIKVSNTKVPEIRRGTWLALDIDLVDLLTFLNPLKKEAISPLTSFAEKII